MDASYCPMRQSTILRIVWLPQQVNCPMEFYNEEKQLTNDKDKKLANRKKRNLKCNLKLC